jgi:hypothetical protein
MCRSHVLTQMAHSSHCCSPSAAPTCWVSVECFEDDGQGCSGQLALLRLLLQEGLHLCVGLVLDSYCRRRVLTQGKGQR